MTDAKEHEMSHHQWAAIFFGVAAFFMLLTWLLALAKRDTLRLDLVAWACAFVAPPSLLRE